MRMFTNSKISVKNLTGTPVNLPNNRRFLLQMSRCFAIVLLFGGMLISGKVQAQYSNVSVTGYNNDIVANGGGTSPNPNTGLTYPSIGCDGVGYTLVQSGYTSPGTPTCFMPVSNMVTSLLTPALTYTLQGYGTSAVNNNNALTITAPSSTYVSPFPTSATLTLSAAANYTKLYALVLSTLNNGATSQTMTATVTFTDASSQVFAGNTFANWFTGSAATTAFYQFNRLNPNNGGYTNVCTAGSYTSQPNMFELNLTLSPENYGKQVSSITFTSTTPITGTGTTADKVNYLHILAVGGLTPCPTPGFQPTALTQGLTTTAQIAASFTEATGTPSGYLTVRYPNAATPTLPVLGTTYTAGQSLGSGTIVQSSNALTYTASGLSGSTSYDFYTYSYNSGATCGGPIYLTASPLTNTFSTNSCGILTGTIPVGPTAPAAPAGFPTLTAAIAHINANGLGGATILELQTDYNSAYAAANETYPLTFPSNPCISITRPLTIRPAAAVASVITLTSSNASTATVLFDGGSYITIDGRPGGTGSNKFISIVNVTTTAGTSGNAVLIRNDAGNNTLTYLDIQSANGNTAVSTAVVAAGTIPGAIAIGTTSGINGNDNNTISFCDIHSTGSNLNVCIYAGNATTAGSLANNDNNTITDNNIYDFFHNAAASAGIDIAVGNNNFNITNNRVYQTATRTYTGAQTIRAFWISPNTASLTSASGFVITGNTIGYNSSAGTGVYTMTGTTNFLFNGMDISVGLGTATLVQGNVITNMNMTCGGSGGTSLLGYNVANGNVNVGTAGGGNLFGSTTSTTGSHAITFTTTVTLGGVMGFRSGGGGTINFTNNIAAGIDLVGNASTIAPSFNGLAASGGTTVNITNNIIGSATIPNSINIVSTSATSTSASVCRGIIVNGSGSTGIVSGNLVANINSNYAATGAQLNTMPGISVLSPAGSYTVSNNTIRNLSSATQTTGSGASSAIVGLSYTSTVAPAIITGNTIHSLKLTGTGTTNNVQLTGMIISGPTSGANEISKNSLHSLSITALNTAGTISGITIAAGAATFSNNMIRLGYDESGASITAGVQIRGISKGTTATNNFYYNSIFIGGTSVISSALNSFAFQRSTAAASVADVIQNNIFVNNRSNATTGGKHFVFTTTANTLLNLNYNAYYFTGTGSLFGSNAAGDVPVYTVNWVGGDANSQVGNPQFLNPTGNASTGNLHLNTALSGIAESGGIVIAGINDDYDGDIRQGSGGYAGTGTAPDMGADEYEGVSAVPVINSLTISPTTIQCAAVPHPVTANVTAAAGGTINSVVINYSINGVAQAGIVMTLTSGTATATSVWDGIIPAPTPVNATIVWSVTAGDGTFFKTLPGGSYSDAPLTGAVVSVSGPANAVCAGTPVTLAAVLNVGKTVTLGTQSTTIGAIGAPYRMGASSIQVKTQYLVLASELTSAGFTAGDFTSLAFTITTTTGSNANMEIRMGQTTATVLNTTFLTSSMQTVFTASTLTPLVGVNTHQFTTPFTWDGTSNIVVELRHVNATTGTSTAAAYNPGFVNGVQVASSTGFSAATGSTFSNRPLLTFTESTIASFVWNDGSSNVGTGNPFIVSPMVNTSYTATTTDVNGCVITSAPFTVTTIALPNPPNGNNATQCGVDVPGVFVTTGGSNGTYKWYSAQTGGTLLQTGGALYTSSINTTTHFWVSESDGTCESVRTEVIATVAPADPIEATVDNASVCLNESIALTATNTAGSPANTYAYTWTANPVAGSGIPTEVSGSTATITPTSAGTYTYTVTGIDGDCTNTAQVTVTVKALPSIISVTANPASMCAGISSTLKALTGNGAAGFGTIGTQTTTSGGSGNPYRSQTGVGNGVKTQYIIKASELTALGFYPGNITSIGFNLTAAAAGTSLSNFNIYMGNTSVNSLSAIFEQAPAMLVYSQATYAPTVGQNTHTFQTPFYWDGASNILIQVCQTNNVQGATTASMYTPGYVGCSQMALSTCATTTATVFNDRPIIRFGGQTGSIGAGTLNWEWNPGALTGNTVSVSPVATTTYTITATDPVTTCSSEMPVTVTVFDMPPAPSGNSSDQCGNAVPTASVSSNSGASTPVFNWYDAPVGGNVVQTGTSTTYPAIIGITTDFYVSEISSAGCEGQRVQVTVTVSEPDAITVAASQPAVCVGGSTNITASYLPGFNTFTIYTLTASPEAGSGMTNPVSLTPNGTGDGSDPYTVTPTIAGNYTYTITAVDPDKGCTSVNSVTVIMDTLPTILSVTATPSTICAGASSVLNVVGAPQYVNVPVTGFNNDIVANGIGSASSSTTENADNGQYTLVSSDWKYNAGCSPVSFFMPNSGTVDANSAVAPGLKYVLQPYNTNNSMRLPVSGSAGNAGVGTFIVTNPVSMRKIFLLYTAGNGPITNGITVTVNFTDASTQVFSNQTAQDWFSTTTPAISNLGRTVRTGSACATTITGGPQLFDMVLALDPSNYIKTVQSITIQKVVNNGTFNALAVGMESLTYAEPDWTIEPGSFTGTTATVTPSITTTYTVTATSPVSGCTATAPVTVTVNQLPAAPSTNDPVTRCGLGSVTLTASGSGGTLNWYNVASGGTSLQTGGSYTTNVTINTSFWVSETSAEGCEGPRTEVHVVVTTPPSLTITPSGATTFCQGTSITLNGATASDPSYVDFNWSVLPSTGAGLSAATGAAVTLTPTLAGTYIITLNANDGSPTGCASISTITITVNPNPVLNNLTATPSTVCSGGSSTLTAQPQYLSVPVTGYNIDIVANGVGSVSSSTTGDFDNVQTLVAADWNFNGSCAPIAFHMPISGKVSANSTVAPGLVYDLQPYTGLNELRIPASGTGITGTGTLTVTTPVNMGKIFLLYGAGNGPITSGITVTVTFTDATTQVFSNLTALDWTATTNPAINNIGKVSRTATPACVTTATGSPYLFDMVLTLNAANYSKQVQSIKIDKTITAGIMNVLAVGMQTPQQAGFVDVTWNPGGLIGNTVTVNPAVTTTYTATASFPATGCSSTGQVTVTANPVASAPVTNSPVTRCGPGTVTMTATNTGGAMNWYDVPTGGVSLFTGDSYTTTVPASTTFYVAETYVAGCEGPRTAVTVTITAAPVLNITASGPTSICENGSLTLDGAVNSDPAFVNFSWSANPSTGSGLTTTTGSTTTITPTTNGVYTYTLTADDNAPASGCANTATIVVTVNPNPVISTLTASPAVVCSGGASTFTLQPQFFNVPVTGFNNDIVANGTGTSNTVSTGTIPGVSQPAIGVDGVGYAFIDPTYKWYSGSATPGCSLPGGGAIPSALTAGLTYQLQSYSGNNALTIASNTYAGSVFPTSGAVSLTSPVNCGNLYVLYETVLNIAGPTITATVTFTDATTQVFAGINPVNWFTATGVAYTPRISRAKNAAPGAVEACNTGPYLFQMNLALSAANQSKSVQGISFEWSTPTGSAPNTIDYLHVMAVGMQTPSTAAYNWTVNPGGITGNPIIVNPTITTTYTATATNPATGCSNSTPVTVTVIPVLANATASTAIPVCAGTAVTLNAGATGGGTLTYSWSDGTAVVGTTSPLTVNPTITTTYTVTVTDGCGATTTSSVTVTVNPLPTAAIQEGPGPLVICQPSTQLLTALSDIGDTYQWTLNGTNIAVNGTGPTYTVSGFGTGTYRVITTNSITGCVSAPSTGVVVTINQQPSVVTVTPPTTTMCANGSPVLLGATGGTILSAATGIATGTSPVGSTGAQSPFYRLFEGSRKQYLISAAELTAMGMVPGSQLTSLAFTVTAMSRTTNVHHNNFNIKIAATSLTSLTSAYVTTGLSIVHGPVSYSPFVGLNNFNFNAPFTWNGTSNVVVEICFDNDATGTCGSGQPICWSNAATVTVATAAAGSSRVNSSDNSTGTTRDMCTLAGSPSPSALRPVMTLGITTMTPTGITWAPTAGLFTDAAGTNAYTGGPASSIYASPSSTTTYTATSTSTAGCTNSATVEVTVNTRPTGVISGGGTYCEGQPTNTDLTLTFTGTGPWNYTYTDGTTPVSGTAASSPHTITVTPTATGVTTYTLTALSDANCASIAEDMTGAGTVTINPLAEAPTATVTQPGCVLATGSITMTAPLGTGNSYTLDGTTTITYPTITFTGVAPGPHTITVTNSFGCSAPASASVTVDPQPFAPGTPVITGIVNVCPYLGTAVQQTYIAAVTGNGTFTYSWTLPPNVVLVAGGGTNSPNNFVTVTFNTGLSNPAQANKQIRVTASNQCGTSPIGVFYLATQAPVTPGPISGPTNVCTLIGTANTATYTINSVLAATGYSWSVPSNATFTSVNGAGVNDTSIVVTFPAGFTGGVVSVAATNGCGSNAVRTLTIVNAPPSTPALIAGPTNVCANIAPGGVAATYSIAPVTYATSYTWIAPAGTIVTHPNGAGPNDHTITVLFPAGFVSGTITVTATNGCGTSGVRSLSVTKLNPGTPSVIDVIQTAFCGDAGGRVFTYTLASMPANATSVLWTIPTTGATIVNGQGTISLTVSYIDGAVNGAVTAQGVNNCGISSVRSTSVHLPACPTEFAGGNQNNGETGTVKGNTTLPTAEVKAMEVKIFPNPTVSDFKLEVLTSRSEEINVRVLDNLGKLYKSFKLMPHQVIALGAELKAGSYFIEVRQGTEVKTTKVIKF